MSESLKAALQSNLQAFAAQPLAEAARNLLGTLGYYSERRLDLIPNTAEQFLATFDPGDTLNPNKALLPHWRAVEMLFQITGDEIRAVVDAQGGLFHGDGWESSNIQSYLFFAVDLAPAANGSIYTRTQIATATREINKLFLMPAMVIFRHNGSLTVAIIARRQNKKDARRDVLEKVTLIKGIRFAQPHRAHIDILADLSLPALANKYTIANFADLQRAWETSLDTAELNKKFYSEVANWYFWAIQNATFPDGAEKDPATRNAISIIRLITRLIFVWFLKEKGLVPPELFDRTKLDALLTWTDSQDSTYYKAILQNLFFATLNTEMSKDKPGDKVSRRFRGKNQSGGQDSHYGISNVYRYESYFSDPAHALDLFANVPFLNGGLFECLDRPQQGIRVDGFSDRADNPLRVPDVLFFGNSQEIDLNAVYETRGRRYQVRGLLHIFGSYKFTVEENTPIEEEVALDPELLGKVFENLLAAYNPETGATARKQTGSFYTPRAIVDYMVDESLFAYLAGRLSKSGKEHVDDELYAKLQVLLAYSNEPHGLTESEKEKAIAAIDNLKVIDPACGSGAFPMGMLHKLVFLLGKLDPNNTGWQQRQLNKAAEILDSTARDASVAAIEAVFGQNNNDYGRKLYLIENCIYGVDIQPIAVQIAKLRCFISLVVDQREDSALPNRGIRALPNLETKFVAANTLVSVERPEQLAFRNPAIEEVESELTDVRRHYFSARTSATKEKYRAEDKQLRANLSMVLQQDGWGKETASQLASWDPYDQNAHAEFFDPEWMFGMADGFDIVIGNPPYLRVQGIQQSQAQYVSYYRKHYSSAQGSFDLYALFIERGYKLLNDHGQFAFIVPHKFFQATFGESLRGLLTRRGALRQIVRFGSAQVFDEATTYTCLLFLSAQPNKHFDLLEVKSLASGDEVLSAARRQELHPAYVRDRLPSPAENDTEWDFSVGEDNRIYRRLQQHPRKLVDITRKIFVGLQTSADKIYVLELRDERADTVLCYSRAIEEEFEIERGLVKPFLMGRDVHRYEPMSVKNVVIFPYTLRDGTAQLMPIDQIEHKYPQGWQYLLRNRDALRNRENGRLKDDSFYAYIYPKNLTEFEVVKIMTPDICGKPEMSIDRDGALYHTTTLYSFVFTHDYREKTLFMLGVLNSRVLWYFLSMTGSVLRGGYLRFKTEYLRPFPIADSNHDQERVVTNLVDYVLFLKTLPEPEDMTSAAELRLMVTYFEQLIDAVVYEMYFPEEFQDANKRPSHLLTAEPLPVMSDIRGDKSTALRTVFEAMYSREHPVRKISFFLDTLETVRVIEARSRQL
jgi:hypothetical protein